MLEILDKSWVKQIRTEGVPDERIPILPKEWMQVAEVYSPPRMTKVARQLGMKAGFALDLTNTDEEGNQWDFSKAEMRAKALKLVDEEQPAILILSPPCTMFSNLQQLNVAKMKDEDRNARAKDAVTHFAFAVMLCTRQSQGKRFFALEHPVAALPGRCSWPHSYSNAQVRRESTSTSACWEWRLKTRTELRLPKRGQASSRIRPAW